MDDGFKWLCDDFFANWDKPWTNELRVYDTGVSGVSVLIASVVSLATDDQSDDR